MTGTTPSTIDWITPWERAAFVQESLSRLAHALQGHDSAAQIAREAMYGAMGLFGIGDAALYVVDFNRENRWLLAADVLESAPRELPELNAFAERLQGDCRRIEVAALAALEAENEHSPWRTLRDRFGQGSLVALKRAERIEGHLWLAERLTGRPWTPEEEGWLISLSQYIAEALERSRMAARLEQLRLDLDRKIFQLMTLFEAGKEIHSFANWDLLTKNLLYTAMGNLGIREGGLLAPGLPQGAFRMWHPRGLRPAKLVESYRLAAADPLLAHLVRVRRAVRREEIAEAFPNHEILLLAFEALAPGLSSRGIEFILALGEKLNHAPFSEDEMEYLMILSTQAAVVFENRDLVRQNIQAERLAAIGQAMAGLGHDFRGILNGLSGATRHLAKMIALLADKQPVDSEQLRRWWSVIRANEERLTDLVEEIVEYSKPRQPVREPCQLNRLILDLAAQREEDLKSRKIKLILDLASSLPNVKVDSTRLFRVLANLLENACDAVAEGSGVIEIRTRMRADAIIAEVKDNGSGIDPEHLPKLFDPLFTTKKGSRGTGFGLANVKKIVEEHGGRVEVSTRLHHGSVFRVEIPLRESSWLLEAAEKQEMPEEPS
jgi:signal transduction histidine kinase